MDRAIRTVGVLSYLFEIVRLYPLESDDVEARLLDALEKGRGGAYEGGE